jgi:uncharacterized membrane protein YedE/YeeE
MNFLSALIAGLLFGAGLLLSGMTNPSNVHAFLDVTGHWQPSLAFTMAAAVAVALPAYHLAHRHERSALGFRIEWPDRFRIDRPLLLGSAIFGIGWGLSGICPGPGLVLLTRPGLHAVSFFAGIVLGSLAASLRPPHQYQPRRSHITPS